MPGQKKPPKAAIWKNVLYFVVILIIIGAFFSLYSTTQEQVAEVGFGEIVQKINNEEVKAIDVVGEQKIEVTLNNDEKLKAQKETSESITTVLENYGVSPEQLRTIDIKVKPESGMDLFLTSFLPFMLPVLLIVGIIWFMMRQARGASNQAMMFGQSKARETNPKDKKNKITFKDVAGVREAKEELMEVVEFLKHPKKFSALG
ncbi:hypothetical protein KKF29_00150, partial [Patescibacteria group bacterium]|nr:hypothetical protein [Patescibacteria group bacterium]